MEGLLEGVDGDLVLRMPGSSWSIWTLVLGLPAIAFVLLITQGVSGLTVVVASAAAALVAIALLQWGDDGRLMTRLWRFARDRVEREPRLPLPAGIWQREFRGVTEFEIVHTLFTAGLIGRYMQGGHQDTLRFYVDGRDQPIHILTRAYNLTSARLRGEGFTQESASDIERELFPDVLSIAATAANEVGVPLYVSEKTFWVGSDSDG